MGSRFTNTVVPRFDGGGGLLATAPTDRPGYCEVKWVAGGNGGAPTICSPGWRGLKCGLVHADGG